MRPAIHMETFTIPIRVQKRHELKGADGSVTGHSWEDVGTRNVEIRVEVDLQGIAVDLAYKAAHAQRKQSKGMHGRVVVRAL